MGKKEFGWWKKLPQDVETIRIMLNRVRNTAVGLSLKVLAISIILIVIAVVLSALYTDVSVQVGEISFMLLIFQVGIIGGLAMGEQLDENTFKAYVDGERD